MKMKRWIRGFCSTVLLSTAFISFTGAASAEQMINWSSEVKTGVYDLNFPIVNENLGTTGFDFQAGKMTKDDKADDFHIYAMASTYNLWAGEEGYGGVGVYEQELTDPSPFVSSAQIRYRLTDNLKVGDMFLVITSDDTFAKMQIDKIAPFKIHFSYVLEAPEEQEQPTQQQTQPTQQPVPQPIQQSTQPYDLPTASSGIMLRLNDKNAIVNGNPTTLNVAPTVINGSTLIPLRFISEALGMDVNFDPYTNTITISQ